MKHLWIAASYLQVNPFYVIGLFLYLLISLKSQRFSDIFSRVERDPWYEMSYSKEFESIKLLLMYISELEIEFY